MAMAVQKQLMDWQPHRRPFAASDSWEFQNDHCLSYIHCGYSLFPLLHDPMIQAHPYRCSLLYLYEWRYDEYYRDLHVRSLLAVGRTFLSFDDGGYLYFSWHW